MDIYTEIVKRRSAGESFVLATIVRTAGSSPRHVGAKMLVFPDSSISGTIGGGTFERLVIEDCVGLFQGNKSHLLKKYRFSQKGPEATGMYCGGEAEVFMELYARPERLIIFGGGHIGKALVKIASGLKFKITVIDDREDILAQYDRTVETLLTDADYNDNLPLIDEKCYVVLVTHGHRCDKSVLEKVIGSNCAYIGMIGSRTKVAKVFSSLKDAGVDKSLLAKVHAPVGLDIGAEGPYEIAISIAAELIAVRKKTRIN